MSHKHSQDALRKIERAMVRGVECPTCGALKWSKCKGTRGHRSANHQSRWNLYRQLKEQNK